MPCIDRLMVGSSKVKRSDLVLYGPRQSVSENGLFGRSNLRTRIARVCCYLATISGPGAHIERCVRMSHSHDRADVPALLSLQVWIDQSN